MIKILLLLALFCNLGHAASAPEEFAAESVVDQLPCGITKSQFTKLGSVLPQGVTITFDDPEHSLHVNGCNNGNITAVISALTTHASGLKLLDLSENQLSILPAKVGDLRALLTLNLYSNQLASLPAEICNLSALTRLILSDNRLRILPVKVGGLRALTYLSLSNNQLTTLPAQIAELTNLINITLHSNPLVEVSDQADSLGLIALRKIFGVKMSFSSK